MLAQEEARRLTHDYVGSEHLLLGLLAVQDGVAGRVLASSGITLELARERIVRTVGGGSQDSPDAIPFAPRAKKLLALALEEALSLGDDHIGTEQGQTARLVAGADATSGDDGPRVTSSDVVSESYRSAPELAQAFGSLVCEPTWWPADTEEISYRLVRSAVGVHYQIGSIRSEGAPICVVGHFEAALAGRSPRDWLSGEWSEPPELAHARGLIGRVGVPRRLRAVIYDEKLQIQLIGYDTEDEI